MKKIYISNLLYLPILIIAVIMVLTPSFIIDFFNIMISLIFIVNGVKHLMDEYIFKSNNFDYNPVIVGILNLSVGLIILLSDISLLNILPTLIGIFCILYSLSIISQLIKIKKINTVVAINKIIAGSVAFLLGLFLFSNTDLASELLIRTLGIVVIMIILNLSLNFYSFSKKVPTVKRIKKK